MADVVRLVLDVVVEKGDPKKVTEVLYKNREMIGGYVSSIVLKADEETEGMAQKAVAGSTHTHDPDSEGGRCSECVRASGRILAAKF